MISPSYVNEVHKFPLTQGQLQNIYVHQFLCISANLRALIMDVQPHAYILHVLLDSDCQTTSQYQLIFLW